MTPQCAGIQVRGVRASSKPPGLREAPVAEGKGGREASERKITDIWLKVQELHAVLGSTQGTQPLLVLPRSCCSQAQDHEHSPVHSTNTKLSHPAPLRAVTAPGHAAAQKGEKKFKMSEHKQLVSG